MKRLTITAGKHDVSMLAVLVLAILLTMLSAGQAYALDNEESQSSGVRFGKGINNSRTAAEPQSVATADLDGDGDLDVVSASQLDGAIHWYRNDADHDQIYGPISVKICRQNMGCAADLANE